MSGRLATAFLGGLVLLVGVAIGATAMRAYDMRTALAWLKQPTTERRAQFVEVALTRRLDLDESQVEAMQEVIESQRPAFEAILAESSDERQALRHELVEEARGFLRPAQIREMERLMRMVDAQQESELSP
ncbi:MAG: hypothetical protein AB8H86_31905 [Polyangiales bacterium]